MTLNWGTAIMDRLLVWAPAKPAAAPQPVVVHTIEHFAPVETEPVRKPQPIDFDDLLRAMGADL